MITKIFLMIAGLALYYNVTTETPPVPVQKTFETMFPTASNVTWQKVDSILWEATFMHNGNNIISKFADDGTWLSSKKEIKIPNLPKNISDNIKLKHPGWEILKAKKIDTAKDGTVYKIEIRKDLIKKSVEYKEDGTEVPHVKEPHHR